MWPCLARTDQNVQVEKHSPLSMTSQGLVTDVDSLVGLRVVSCNGRGGVWGELYTKAIERLTGLNDSGESIIILETSLAPQPQIPAHPAPSCFDLWFSLLTPRDGGKGRRQGESDGVRMAGSGTAKVSCLLFEKLWTSKELETTNCGRQDFCT